MNEHFVTQTVREELESLGWNIISVDFPSGSGGTRLHSENRPSGSKHGESIVPDIIAHKHRTLLIVECAGIKKGFSRDDVTKLRDIAEGEYSKSIEQQFQETPWDILKCGIGLPQGEAPSWGDIPTHLDMVMTVGQSGDVAVEEI